MERRDLLATLYVDSTPVLGGPGADQFTASGGSQVNVGNLTQGIDLFTTISAAVSAAAPGDVINVADGTYSELVTVNKTLTLLGNQFGIDARTRGVVSESIVTGNAGTTSFIVAANDVQIDGFTVRDQTNVNQFGAGVFLQPGTAGTEFRNNIVEFNVIGLFLANADAGNQTVIERNVFRENNQPGAGSGNGIYLDQFTAGGAVTNVLISNNLFQNNNSAGINFSSTDPALPTSNITVVENTFDNNGNALALLNTTNSSIAQNVMTGSNGSQIAILGGASNLVIVENFIENGDARGIRILDLIGVPNQNISISNNSIQNNALAGLEVEVGAYVGTLNAEFNWWGSPSGPTSPDNPAGTGQEIVAPPGTVDFVPFLTSGVDTQPGIAGFQPDLTSIGIAGGSIRLDFNESTNNIEVYVNNVLVFAGQPTTLTINGSNGNDDLTVDFTGGGNPIPSGGLTFHGLGETSAPGDTLAVVAGAFGLVTLNYAPAGADGNNGSIVLDGSTIVYTGLEPIAIGGTVADVIINLPTTDGNNQAILEDDGVAANGLTQLRSGNGTFETTVFPNPSNSLTLNTGDDGETVSTLAVDSGYAPAAGTLFSGGAGADTFNLGATIGGALTIAGGGGDDSVVFGDGVTLGGGTIDGGAGQNTLDYTAYSAPVAVNLGVASATLSTTMDGTQETPANTSAASASANLTYNGITKTFDITVTVTGLFNTITGFHLHIAAVGVAGPIIVPFNIADFVPGAPGVYTFAATNVPLPALNEAAFLGGLTYLNIHTNVLPGGEIRGQVLTIAQGTTNPPQGTATGTGGITSIDHVIGGSAGDSLVGNFNANTMTGGAGNDTIFGSLGDDTLQGGAGNDFLLVNGGLGLETEIIDGGTGSDTVLVNGTLLANSFVIGAGIGGRLAVTVDSTTLDIGGVESLSASGFGGDDTFNVNSLAGVADLTTISLNGLDGNDTFNVTPSATVSITVRGHLPSFPTLPGDTLNYIGAGTVTPSGIGGGSITAPGVQPVTFSNIEELTGGPFDVVTPGAIDVFNNKIDASIVTVATASGQVSFDANSLNTLSPGNGVVNLIGDNNDTIDQTDNFVVIGTGPNAFDLLINGSPAISFVGVLFLNVIGHDLVDTLELTAYADNADPGGHPPRGWGIQVTFDEGLPDGADGDQADLLIYNTVAANPVSEKIVVQPSGPEDGELLVTNAVDGSVIVVVSYVNNLDIVVNDNDGFASDSDTLTLRGTNPDTVATSGNETIVADFTAAGDVANPLVTVSDTVGGAILYRLRSFTGFGSINISSLAGADTISLTNRIGLTVNVDGGDPVSGDVLSVAVPANARFTQGADATTGLIDQAGVGDINIANVELVNISAAAGPSTLTIRGTDDDDTIAVGLIGGITAAWINDGAVVGYNTTGGAFTNVLVQGRFGSDSFSVTPHAGVDITIQGGDPTASDTVVVNGTPGSDTINYSPTAADGGTVQVNALGLVTLQTVEHLTINGQGGGDSLTYTTPAIGAEVTLTPGATADAGVITASQFDASSLLELSYENLDETGSLTFANVNGGRSDGLDIIGTDNDDQFNVSAAGVVQIVKPAFLLPVTVPINTPGVTFLRLMGRDGDDSFNIPGNHPISVGIEIQGGNPSASDVVNFAGTGGAITVDYGAGTVQEAGFGPVFLTGVELLNIDAAGGDLTALGTTGNETLDVSITGESSGTATSSAVGAPVTTFASVGVFSVDLLGGDNTLRLHYGSDPETIIIDGAAGTVTATNDETATALETVNFANVDSLRVFGNEGNDAFTVTPGAMPIFVDGGDPIGTIPGDSLTINGAHTFFAGPENDEGGFLTSGETVSFDHIERVIVASNGDCPFLILGTNADDDITVIARDATYDAAADGVQDFTVSVNAGIEVLFLNEPDLYIDAGSGDDDIVIRAPAPNGASWGVHVRVAGGPPSIGETNEADRLVLETPGQDNLIFTPTGPDTGTLLIDEAGNGAFDAGIDTLITLGSFVFVCPDEDFTHVSSPGGVELVEYDGEDDLDVITIAGTAGNDTTTISPAARTGSFVSSASPLFHFRSFGQVTVNPGAGGFDQVIVNGTEGPDAVLSTADTLTGLGAAVTIGAGIDQLNLNTLGGDDSIILSLAVPGLAKIIDAGAGNDLVDLSGVAVDPADPTIYGGDGDDVIIGSPNADLIFGGRGNDTIDGGAGDDVLYGEEGNDILTGGPGADQMFGGDGSDTFIWNPGDASDLIEGGAGESDVLIFNGSAAAELFTLNAVGTRLELLRNIGNIDMDVAGVEEVVLNMLGGVDAVTINDLTQTDVRMITVDLGPGDGAADTVTVNGRQVPDTVDISSPAAGTVDLIGLAYDVRLTSTAPADLLVFNGLGGDDRVESSDNLNGVIGVTLNGGAGNDTLIGFGTLNGDAGDDLLIGGALGQSINGGPGEDTMIGNGGNDIFDGGPDFDTILVRGTSGNDIISANQTGPNTLVTTLNGVIDTDTLVTVGGVRTVERVRIEAGSGDDTIFVMHVDSLGQSAVVDAVLFDIDGGSAETRDRLSVQDSLTGDLVLYRKGESDSAGSISVGPGNPESLETVFTNVEFIQPIAGPGGQLLVFKHDPYENNDERINATHLGAGETINVDPNIDPGPFTAVPAGFAPLPGDQDWYRVVAEKTGTLDFQVYFTMITTVASGRPGLPNGGNLDIELYDADGTLIVDGLGAFGVNDATDNERIRIPAVQGQIYFLRVFGVDTAINNYSITVVNDAGPTPYGLELDDQPVGDGLNSDTGRSQFDNITRDNTPTLVIRLDDAFFLNDLPGNPVPDSPPDEVIPIPFRAGPAQPLLPGYAIAIFDEGPNPNPAGTAPQVPLGFATQTSPGVYEFTTPVLVDGSHFLSARVQLIDPALPQQTGFTARSALLEIVVDTVPPPVSLGEPGIPDDGVISDSDTGVSPPNPHTIVDNVTFDTTPTFWGRAEANAIIRVYADVNGNGTLEIGTDVFLGQDTAIPLDGTNQEPDGYWEIESVVSLNDPNFFPIPDGLRTIFVTAEDVAGNVNAAGGAAGDTLQIFVDTQGPRVTDVDINNAGNPYDLFDPKPSTDGPTPLVNSLVISFSDLPNRLAPDFLFPALKQDVAESPGHYLLVGDYNGIIPIAQVIVTNIPPVSGQPALATVELVFATPLPDDRFTLSISDSISDPVGNALDGESNADEPHENPTFPSGDGIPGGDFVARFTIDSRPEVGTWGAGSAWIDTNGNTSFDPTNADFTNRDITYMMGFTSDDLFAGNFALGAGDVADGFDKLAAYGRFNGVWRWLIDTDNDGVPNINQVDPAGINGLPFAGNFDGNPANGDEVGVFTGTTWWFDTNHDFQLDFSIAASPGFVGYPVVGDFDGDGFEDLGAWTDDTFRFNLSSTGPTLNANLVGLTGTVERSFRFGFPGPNERPVAADMNQDGFDDIGLYVPNRAGVSPDESAEWYILVSGQVQNNDNNGPAVLGPSIIDRIVTDPIDGKNVVRFTPVPFGNDLYIQYGDEFGLPILGNFDPPVVAGTPIVGGSDRDPRDVNNDGKITAFDALLIINHMNQHGPGTPVVQTAFPRAPFLDVNGNGTITASDALAVVNYLNAKASGAALPSPEGEADEFFSTLGERSRSSEDEVLALLADDLESQQSK
ncbi:MAG TPA: CHRD domain-containing protein [Pirellulaceae bacterium]|nr:CHRD domain-containing protein [Pirellulaceae bacterium]